MSEEKKNDSLVAIPDNSKQIVYYNKTLLFNTVEQQHKNSDIIIETPDIHNHLIIPFLSYIYTSCVNKFTNKNITFLFKQNPDANQVEIPTQDRDEVQLEPFPYSPCDVVCFGGSFDRLHYGHKVLITAAALLCKKKLIVGISRNVKKKEYSDIIQPLHFRISSCIDTIYKINPDIVVKVHVIDDVCGPTAFTKHIDLLVLSEETRAGGDEVNKVRQSKGLAPIENAAIPIVKMRSSRLSSSILRELEVHPELLHKFE